jgi:hypothetical protein
MAWYTSHEIRFRGRLVTIMTRYGCLEDAVVVKGKPLDLREGSRDFKRLSKLFGRNQRIQREISDFQDSL